MRFAHFRPGARFAACRSHCCVESQEGSRFCAAGVALLEICLGAEGEAGGAADGRASSANAFPEFLTLHARPASRRPAFRGIIPMKTAIIPEISAPIPV